MSPANITKIDVTKIDVRKIRLPRSARGRNARNFAILVRRILPQRVMGDAFDGPRLRPGTSIDLWPEADYPKNPLLVEYAGTDCAGSGHRRSTHTYILWRYDVAAGEWVELVRCPGISTEWVEPLKAVALRHLKTAEPDNPSAVADAASRVVRVLDVELEPFESIGRSELMGVVWRELSARMVNHV